MYHPHPIHIHASQSLIVIGTCLSIMLIRRITAPFYWGRFTLPGLLGFAVGLLIILLRQAIGRN